MHVTYTQTNALIHSLYIAFKLLQSCIHSAQHLSPTLCGDPTCVGDGMPWPVSVSFGVGRGPRPNEQPSSLTDVDCSGDRLSLVSSSNEEFSPEALWNCVSERRSIVGETREGNKHYLVKLDHKINVLPSDSRSLPKSVCLCNTITCINRSWAIGLLLVTLTPCGHLQSRQIITGASSTSIGDSSKACIC